MATGIKKEPIIARDAIRKDPRFDTLRTHPRFAPAYQRLIPTKRPTARPTQGGGFGGFGSR